MLVINARNVNDAYASGLHLLQMHGLAENSRAGTVIVMPYPVTTQYSHPKERVLFDDRRDANPFFHLMEALWMLAGSNDATWLDQFVSDFSERFSENGIQHGAYGHRWRKAFGFDQLDHVISTLRKDPTSRQAVIQMWDSTPTHRQATITIPPKSGWTEYGCDDLRGSWKDRPCNTHAYLRVRRAGELLPAAVDFVDITEPVLDMTVCCRSNDIIWGAYGANAVHFSVLQEYLAVMIGVKVGTYYQISNNYHAYQEEFSRVVQNKIGTGYDDFMEPTKIVESPDTFERDLLWFFMLTAADSKIPGSFTNRFFPEIALPMFRAYKLWRLKERYEAFKIIADMPVKSDWRAGCLAWMNRRMVKLKAKANATS